MRLSHFEAFAPICPVCARRDAPIARLVIAAVAAESAGEIETGTLHCPSCKQEYPIFDGIPIIVPELRRLLAERGVELLLNDEIDPAAESLIGDAIGPDSWFDALRQVQSTYGWDGYGDLDPAEPAPKEGVAAGSVRRCLARLLELAGTADAREAALPSRVLDLGCAAGRTSFDLAASDPQSLVLGIDQHLGLLRLARRASRGAMSYPRRRIGLVYDRRRFPVDLRHRERVDFWASDALALPFAPGVAKRCVALNLLDCVADPRLLLQTMAQAVAPGGQVLIATPYDWSTRATPVEAWLGGHSQRAHHGGAGEAVLAQLTGGLGEPYAIPGLTRLAEQAEWPWTTRLHDRSAVQYRTHLVALSRG